MSKKAKRWIIGAWIAFMLLWLGWLQTFEFYSPAMYYGTFFVCNLVIGIVVILVVTIKWGADAIRNNVRFGLAILWLFLGTAGAYGIAEYISGISPRDRTETDLLTLLISNLVLAFFLIPRLINPDPLIDNYRERMGEEKNRRVGIDFLSAALGQVPPKHIKILSVSEDKIVFRIFGTIYGEAAWPVVLFSFIPSAVLAEMTIWWLFFPYMGIGLFVGWKLMFRKKVVTVKKDEIWFGNKKLDPQKIGRVRATMSANGRDILAIDYGYGEELIGLPIDQGFSTSVINWTNDLLVWFYGSPKSEASSAVHEKGYREQSY